MIRPVDRFLAGRLLLPMLALLVGAPGSAQLPGVPEDGKPAVQDEAGAPTEEAPAPLAAVDESADLAARLNVIFDNIGSLSDVTAEVGAGVVRLSGTVVSTAARDQAESIAAQQEGIVAVDNRIAIARDIARRLEPVRSKLEERAFDLLASLPLLVVAIAILGVSWLLARWIGRRERLYRRVSENRFVRDLAARVTSSALFVLGVLLALEVLDATAMVGAVLGAAGVIGLAVGFAFKDLVENYIASILLSIRQPFAPGDHVVVGDREGKVVRLTSRATVLITLDGNHLRIPNADVFKGTVLNYSTNPRRRFEFRVGVGVGEGLERVRLLALEVLSEMEGVLDDPEPLVLIDQLGDSTVNLVLFGWVDQRRVSFPKVRSEAIRRVKERFDAEEVSMPEPTYRVQWTGSEPPVPGERSERGPRPVSGAARTPAAQDGDIEPETHLDEEIAEERAREEDLLSSDGRTE